MNVKVVRIHESALKEPDQTNVFNYINVTTKVTDLSKRKKSNFSSQFLFVV